MIKLGKVLYERILAQASEAKELNLTELSDGVLSALGPVAREDSEDVFISQAELEKEIYKQLWKIAFDIMAYHDAKKVDIQKIGSNLESFSKDLVQSIENSIGKQGEIGKMEPKIPGQDK